MSNYDPIENKFSMTVELDVLNNIPKFGSNQLISGLTPTRTKKFS